MAFDSTVKFGHECKVYNNTGTHASPTWNELNIVKDVTLNMSQNESDISSRAGKGYVMTAGTLIDASIDFSVTWDPADSADFSELQNAFFDRKPVELLILDGDRTDAGNEGLQAFFVVTNFTRNESIAEAVSADITCKITKNPRESGSEITDVPNWVVTS
tara:strand:- start:1008 stop:1487 length:480 start_codon:yes stop_codon:yes gene_type:complete